MLQEVATANINAIKSFCVSMSCLYSFLRLLFIVVLHSEEMCEQQRKEPALNYGCDFFVCLKPRSPTARLSMAL